MSTNKAICVLFLLLATAVPFYIDPLESDAIHLSEINSGEPDIEYSFKFYSHREIPSGAVIRIKWPDSQFDIVGLLSCSINLIDDVLGSDVDFSSFETTQKTENTIIDQNSNSYQEQDELDLSSILSSFSGEEESSSFNPDEHQQIIDQISNNPGVQNFEAYMKRVSALLTGSSTSVAANDAYLYSCSKSTIATNQGNFVLKKPLVTGLYYELSFTLRGPWPTPGPTEFFAVDAVAKDVAIPYIYAENLVFTQIYYYAGKQAFESLNVTFDDRGNLSEILYYDDFISTHVPTYDSLAKIADLKAFSTNYKNRFDLSIPEDFKLDPDLISFAASVIAKFDKTLSGARGNMIVSVKVPSTVKIPKYSSVKITLPFYYTVTVNDPVDVSTKCLIIPDNSTTPKSQLLLHTACQVVSAEGALNPNVLEFILLEDVLPGSQFKFNITSIRNPSYLVTNIEPFIVSVIDNSRSLLILKSQVTNQPVPKIIFDELSISVVPTVTQPKVLLRGTTQYLSLTMTNNNTVIPPMTKFVLTFYPVIAEVAGLNPSKCRIDSGQRPYNASIPISCHIDSTFTITMSGFGYILPGENLTVSFVYKHNTLTDFKVDIGLFPFNFISLNQVSVAAYTLSLTLPTETPTGTLSLSYLYFTIYMAVIDRIPPDDRQTLRITVNLDSGINIDHQQDYLVLYTPAIIHLTSGEDALECNIVDGATETPVTCEIVTNDYRTMIYINSTGTPIFTTGTNLYFKITPLQCQDFMMPGEALFSNPDDPLRIYEFYSEFFSHQAHTSSYQILPFNFFPSLGVNLGGQYFILNKGITSLTPTQSVEHSFFVFKGDLSYLTYELMNKKISYRIYLEAGRFSPTFMPTPYPCNTTIDKVSEITYSCRFVSQFNYDPILFYTFDYIEVTITLSDSLDISSYAQILFVLIPTSDTLPVQGRFSIYADSIMVATSFLTVTPMGPPSIMDISNQIIFPPNGMLSASANIVLNAKINTEPNIPDPILVYNDANNFLQGYLILAKWNIEGQTDVWNTRCDNVDQLAFVRTFKDDDTYAILLVSETILHAWDSTENIQCTQFQLPADAGPTYSLYFTEAGGRTYSKRIKANSASTLQPATLNYIAASTSTASNEYTSIILYSLTQIEVPVDGVLVLKIDSLYPNSQTVTCWLYLVSSNDAATLNEETLVTIASESPVFANLLQTSTGTFDSTAKTIEFTLALAAPIDIGQNVLIYFSDIVNPTVTQPTQVTNSFKIKDGLGGVLGQTSINAFKFDLVPTFANALYLVPPPVVTLLIKEAFSFSVYYVIPFKIMSSQTLELNMGQRFEDLNLGNPRIRCDVSFLSWETGIMSVTDLYGGNPPINFQSVFPSQLIEIDQGEEQANADSYGDLDYLSEEYGDSSSENSVSEGSSDQGEAKTSSDPSSEQESSGEQTEEPAEQQDTAAVDEQQNSLFESLVENSLTQGAATADTDTYIAPPNGLDVEEEGGLSTSEVSVQTLYDDKDSYLQANAPKAQQSSFKEYATVASKTNTSTSSKKTAKVVYDYAYFESFMKPQEVSYAAQNIESKFRKYLVNLIGAEALLTTKTSKATAAKSTFVEPKIKACDVSSGLTKVKVELLEATNAKLFMKIELSNLMYITSAEPSYQIIGSVKKSSGVNIQYSTTNVNMPAPPDIGTSIGTLLGVFPQTEGLIASYQFSIELPKDLTPESMLFIRIPLEFPPIVKNFECRINGALSYCYLYDVRIILVQRVPLTLPANVPFILSLYGLKNPKRGTLSNFLIFLSYDQGLTDLRYVIIQNIVISERPSDLVVINSVVLDKYKTTSISEFTFNVSLYNTGLGIGEMIAVDFPPNFGVSSFNNLRCSLLYNNTDGNGATITINASLLSCSNMINRVLLSLKEDLPARVNCSIRVTNIVNPVESGPSDDFTILGLSSDMKSSKFRNYYNIDMYVNPIFGKVGSSLTITQIGRKQSYLPFELTPGTYSDPFFVSADNNMSFRSEVKLILRSDFQNIILPKSVILLTGQDAALFRIGAPITANGGFFKVEVEKQEPYSLYYENIQPFYVFISSEKKAKIFVPDFVKVELGGISDLLSLFTASPPLTSVDLIIEPTANSTGFILIRGIPETKDQRGWNISMTLEHDHDQFICAVLAKATVGAYYTFSYHVAGSSSSSYTTNSSFLTVLVLPNSVSEKANAFNVSLGTVSSDRFNFIVRTLGGALIFYQVVPFPGKFDSDDSIFARVFASSDKTFTDKSTGAIYGGTLIRYDGTTVVVGGLTGDKFYMIKVFGLSVNLEPFNVTITSTIKTKENPRPLVIEFGTNIVVSNQTRNDFLCDLGAYLGVDPSRFVDEYDQKCDLSMYHKTLRNRRVLADSGLMSDSKRQEMVHKLEGTIDTSTDDTIKNLSASVKDLGIDTRVLQNMGSTNIQNFVNIIAAYKFVQAEPSYETQFRFYILQNNSNHDDLPKNYFKAIDNSLKMCHFILSSNPNFVVVLIGADLAGGSLTRLNSLPKIVTEGKVVKGLTHLSVLIELDREGVIYAVIVNPTSATPKSEQISRGKTSEEVDAVAKVKETVKFDQDFNLKRAKLNFTGLQPGQNYTVYYTLGLDLPGDKRVSPMVQRLATSTLNLTAVDASADDGKRRRRILVENFGKSLSLFVPTIILAIMFGNTI